MAEYRQSRQIPRRYRWVAPRDRFVQSSPYPAVLRQQPSRRPGPQLATLLTTMTQADHLRRIRFRLAVFIAGLVLSGITAFPLHTELGWFVSLLHASWLRPSACLTRKSITIRQISPERSFDYFGGTPLASLACGAATFTSDWNLRCLMFRLNSKAFAASAVWPVWRNQRARHLESFT